MKGRPGRSFTEAYKRQCAELVPRWRFTASSNVPSTTVVDWEHMTRPSSRFSRFTGDSLHVLVERLGL